MKRRSTSRIQKSFLLSMLVHGLLVALLFVSSLWQKSPAPQTVQLEIIDSLPVAASEAKKTDKTKKPLPIEKNQIVDQQDQALNDEKPDNARFLSKNNQVVKKQTVAQHLGEFKNKATQQSINGEHGTAQIPTKLDLKPHFDIAKSIRDRIENEKKVMENDPEGILPKTQDAASNKPREMAAGAPKAKGAETSQTLDYIKDLDPGLETLLSTKEFVYYTYFNRIRNQLNQYWSDRVRQKLTEMYKKGRHIASTSDDKVTKCLVTLDISGKLLKVQIIGDSGVVELDEAATEAFRAAAPFPNPPKGMVDPDGTIKIRWDFILEA